MSEYSDGSTEDESKERTRGQNVKENNKTKIKNKINSEEKLDKILKIIG